MSTPPDEGWDHPHTNNAESSTFRDNYLFGDPPPKGQLTPRQESAVKTWAFAVGFAVLGGALVLLIVTIVWVVDLALRMMF